MQGLLKVDPEDARVLWEGKPFTCDIDYTVFTTLVIGGRREEKVDHLMYVSI